MPSRHEARLRHAGRFLTRLREIEELFQQGGDRAKRASEEFVETWPQIQAGQAWVERNAQDDECAVLCSGFASAGGSRATGESLLDMRRHPREQVRWLNAGVVAGRRLRDRRVESVHLYDLGLMYVELHEYQSSVRCLEQALCIFREMQDRQSEGIALNALGSVYRFTDEVRDALDHFERALAIFREIGSQKDVAFTLSFIGSVYKKSGENGRATECYESALAIFRDLGDRAGEASALKELGAHYVDLGDTRRGRECLEKAAALFQERSPQVHKGFYSTELTGLGLSYVAMADRQGIEHLERDLVTFRDVGNRLGEGFTILSLGLAHAVLNEMSRAVQLYEEALPLFREVGNQLGEALTLQQLGLAHTKQGAAQVAIDSFDQSLGLFRAIGQRRSEGNVLWYMSRSMDELNRRAEAIRCAEAAREIFEQIEHPSADEVRQRLSKWRQEK